MNGPSSLAIAVTGLSEMIGNLFYSSFLRDRKAPTVGSNDPCPCGSGKKYKKCQGSVVKGKNATEPSRLPQHGELHRPTYQRLAAHGYAPWQVGEMLPFV